MEAHIMGVILVHGKKVSFRIYPKNIPFQMVTELEVQFTQKQLMTPNITAFGLHRFVYGFIIMISLDLLHF